MRLARSKGVISMGKTKGQNRKQLDPTNALLMTV